MTFTPSTHLIVSETKILEVPWLTYRLLASLFLYPDKERLASLQDVAMALMEDSAWRESSSHDLFEDLLDQLVEIEPSQRKNLVDEYNRLFFVKPKAPPYESYHLDREGQLRGLITSELEGEYRQAGLKISPELNELPDHLSVELEFMAFLCEKECQASRANDKPNTAKFHLQKREFLIRHLAQWFPKFFRCVKEASPGRFYHIVILTTFVFLRQELENQEMSGCHSL